MRTVTELRAIALLVLRSWYRMGPRLRGGRKPEPTRGVSALLMRLVFAALIYNFGYTSSLRVLAHEQPERAASFAGLGAGLFVLATAFALELPSPRMPTQALRSELLELLPLSGFSKLILLLAQASLTLPVTLALALTLHPDTGEEASSRLGALLLSLMLFAGFGLLGACFGKLARLVLPAHQASRLGWLSSVPLLGGVLLLQLAPTLEELPEPSLLGPLGAALLGRAVWPFVGALGGMLGLLGATFLRLEQRHELAPPVRPGKVASVLGRGADLARLERVLDRRDPGGTFQLPFAVLFSATMIGLLSFRPGAEHDTQLLWSFSALITLQMTSTLAMQRATRSATRELLARPLLGALPIAPSDTLRSKGSTLSLRLLLVAAPIVLLMKWSELWWRVAATLLAVWIFGLAATYVAFLTVGLGASRPRGGALGSLESFLLAIPFASVLFAPGPPSGALSLATLAALTFVARRAALGTIDWLDDPEREHGTEIWKALVVFGAFQGTQLLTQQLTEAFGGGLSPAVRLLLTYSLAALVLWLMTQREQETRAPELRWALAPLGVVAGALSAACAWLYLELVRPVASEGARLEAHGTVEAICLTVAVGLLAPLIEERFFRGWLQPALERALEPRRYLAPLLTALAFAAAHPAYSFVPVLVLGVVNGFLLLRFRSLSACMVAHALHNACALYLGAR